MTEKKTRAERQQDLLAIIELEGAELAVETAMAICRDTKAPAPARATALTALLRAGGYLAAKPEGLTKKEPHEMDAAELDAEIRRLRTIAAKPADDTSGVFD